MRFLIFSFFLCCFGAFGQDSITMVKRSNFAGTGGLVAYYFWEEDSLGFLVPGTFTKPYVQNVCIIQNQRKKHPEMNPNLQDMIELVGAFAKVSHPKLHSEFSMVGSDKKKKSFPLFLYATAKDYESMLYVKRGNTWNMLNRSAVQYFSVQADGRTKFEYSSDSVKLESGHVIEASNSQYQVYSIYLPNGELSYQRVLNYAGDEVTTQFLKPTTTQAKRFLIFVNGYRGPLKEKDYSDNLVSANDRYGYWFKLDNRFIERLDPDTSFFLDAHFSVKTSIHKRRLGFVRALVFWSFSNSKSKPIRVAKRMSKHTKDDGFIFRKEKGRIAGTAFLYARCSSPSCDKVKDTIDLVCHSMGYAYMLGFLETVKDEVVLGSCYIIAPENASLGGYDWSKFETVWQYGANLDQEKPDPLRYQDGVAPQMAVLGLDKLPPSKGGRVFIPDDWPNKQFIHSHMVYSYDWIFDRILPGMPGYITTKH